MVYEEITNENRSKKYLGKKLSEDYYEGLKKDYDYEEDEDGNTYIKVNKKELVFSPSGVLIRIM